MSTLSSPPPMRLTSPPTPPHQQTVVPRPTFATLNEPTGPSFLVLGFLARLPMAMLALGMLLLVSGRTGSFAAAGTVVAALSVGGAVGGTLIGQQADRFGHRVVGLVSTTLFAGLLGIFVLVASRGGTVSTLVGLAVGVGLVSPPIGSLARSRWLEIGRQRPDRDVFVPAAMGQEAAVDEISYVLGPVLVGVLALAGPSVGLLTALGIAVVAQIGFAAHPTAAGRRVPTPGARTPLPVRRIAPLAAVVACVGLVFGTSQTAVTAKLADLGQQALTGPVYAGMGLGSAASALVVGRVLHRVALRTRIVASGIGLSLTSGVLLVATGPLAITLACLLVGLTVAPVLVSAYALAERIVPPGRSATVMAVLSTATVTGVALGAAAAGIVIDGSSPRWAVLISVTAGLLAAAIASIGQIWLRGPGLTT